MEFRTLRDDYEQGLVNIKMALEAVVSCGSGNEYANEDDDYDGDIDLNDDDSVNEKEYADGCQFIR